MSRRTGTDSSASLGKDATAHKSQPAGVLADADGPIPAFPPRAWTRRAGSSRSRPRKRGAAQRGGFARSRHCAACRTRIHPTRWSRLMRGVDEHRPPGRKLFEEMS